MAILKFGKTILDFIENSTNRGDTILFSLDSNLYEQEIFSDDSAARNEFEKEIKKFVNTYGLDLRSVLGDEKDLYSIALAAHQIILSYQYRDDSTINDALLRFYFPYQSNSNILYSKYYGNNQYADNYQEKLWCRVQTVIQNKLGRKLIIPINPGGNRDQKFIKSQLCLLRNLKKYFFSVFYQYGFSKEIQYSKDEFVSRIKTVNKELNNKMTDKIVDSLWDELRKYSQEDFGLLTLDDNLLYELLWTMYETWDGTFPYDGTSRSSDDYYNPIYVELNDDEYTFNTQQDQCFQTLLTSTTDRRCYFRFFTYIGDDVWEVKDSVISDLPESETFVLLIKKDDKKLFSKKCMMEYKPSVELLDNNSELGKFLILKYFSLPRDFYDYFPDADMAQSNAGLQLRGGIKLSGKNYLDFSDKRLRPSICSGSQRIEQKAESGIINGVKIEEYKTEDTNRLRLHFYSFTDKRNLNNYNLLYKNMPEFKFSKNVINSVQVDKSGVDITSYKFRADMNGLVSKGRFIPGSRIKVVIDNDLVSVKEFEEFSEYNRSQLLNVKFGWFEKDDELFSPSESVSDRLKIIKTLEFKVKLVNEEPQISEFWVTEVYDCNIEEYYGTDNYSKEPEVIDEVVSVKKDDYSEFKYICINENELYMPKAQEIPVYYDELKAYQKALCVWLCYCGVASYRDIQNVCRTMVQKTEFSEVYGETPEYQIFTPLFKTGIIIPVLNKKNETFFTVIDKYDEILLGLDLAEVKDLQNDIVDMTSMLNRKELFVPIQLCERQVFVRFSKFSWTWQSRRMDTCKIFYSCIYKIGFEPWKSVYFKHKKNHYLIIKDNPDVYSICKSIINREHYLESTGINSAFEYFPKQKLLLCRYFSDIPSFYTRLLMFADSKKFGQKEVYLSGTKNYREQYFENIDYEFVKELDKKLVK